MKVLYIQFTRYKPTSNSTRVSNFIRGSTCLNTYQQNYIQYMFYMSESLKCSVYPPHPLDVGFVLACRSTWSKIKTNSSLIFSKTIFACPVLAANTQCLNSQATRTVLQTHPFCVKESYYMGTYMFSSRSFNWGKTLLTRRYCLLSWLENLININCDTAKSRLMNTS